MRTFLKKLKLLILISCPLQAVVEKAHLDSNWYPNTQEALQATLRELSKKAEQQYDATLNPAAIRAVIVPHAGYAYSGAVAAAVYRLLDKKNIKKVIILAPDHAVSFEGVALPIFDRYQTPLGTLHVDTSAVKKLGRNALFHQESSVFEREHSLELQLPFVQTYLAKDVTILPLIVGRITCSQAHIIAQTLKQFIDKNSLVVVTTDFVHYGKQFNFRPFKEHIGYNIRTLDSQAVQLIEEGICAPFVTFMERTKATICGYYPLQIFLSLLEIAAFGTVEPRFISYDSSGQQEKNMESSVSYVGMLFTQQKLDTVPIEQQLTEQEQHALLQEAQDVLKNIYDNRIPEELLYPIKSFGVIQPHGAFATLEKQGKQLRGCIGRITTTDPLYKTVAIVTRDTALHDSRFAPVQKSELPDLSLKLSVLSPVHPIASYKDIILGKHGVILDYLSTSAVFLPEVPLEFKWNLTQMLEELSQKAGLPVNAWKNKEAQFSIFSGLTIEK